MKNSLLYSLILIFVVTWWILAAPSRIQPLIQPPVIHPLSFSREELKKGLQGDLASIHHLTKIWAEGPLKNNLLCKKAHNLASSFIHPEKNSSSLQFNTTPHQFFDDEDQAISCPEKGPFLPQTLLSASVLLALLEPEQIVALPKIMRKHPEVFPKEKMAKVKENTNRYRSEAIKSKRPGVAFVAHYSNPTTVQALQNQGLSLIYIHHLCSIQDCIHNIRRIGWVVGQHRKAEMLALFTECALLVIDKELQNITIGRPLYLHTRDQFSYPTTKAIQGKLLERIGCLTILHQEPEYQWSHRVSQEEIASFNPDALFFPTLDQEALLSYLNQLPSIQQTTAYKNGKIFFLDEMLQSSVSQMSALAYYDLCSAVQSAYLQTQLQQ